MASKTGRAGRSVSCEDRYCRLASEGFHRWLPEVVLIEKRQTATRLQSGAVVAGGCLPVGVRLAYIARRREAGNESAGVDGGGFFDADHLDGAARVRLRAANHLITGGFLIPLLLPNP